MILRALPFDFARYTYHQTLWLRDVGGFPEPPATRGFSRVKRSSVPLGLKAQAKPTRFSWVLEGASCGPDRAFDVDLASHPDAAVLPTRGAMVAEWMLIVPRVPCMSVAALETSARKRVLHVADDAAARISARVGSSVIFEHGPGNWGSLANCGVDQAHLHVVGGAPLSVDALMSQVGELGWEVVNYDDPWSSIDPGCNYLLLRDELRAVSASVKRPVSQRLRRAVAAALNRPDEWDYRLHPYPENALLTQRIFQSINVCAA